jgi:hypothetical protein
MAMDCVDAWRLAVGLKRCVRRMPAAGRRPASGTRKSMSEYFALSTLVVCE